MKGNWNQRRKTPAFIAVLALVLIQTWGPADASSYGALGSVRALDNGSKQVAIVIDDFGNDMKGTEEMLALPFSFTAAVMPFMPTTKKDAEAAHTRGHEVIVHMPMEPVSGKRSWLGPGAITAELSDEEIRRRIEAAIRDVPHAVGMNNHMGSRITADKRIMRIVLEVCKENGLFFLDSRTTDKSVIPQLGEELGVAVIQNDVFLDEVYSTAHIHKQLAELSKHIREQSVCVAIGHVGPPGLKTAAALKETQPVLSRQAQFIRTSQAALVLFGDKAVLPDAVGDRFRDSLLLARIR